MQSIERVLIAAIWFIVGIIAAIIVMLGLMVSAFCGTSKEEFPELLRKTHDDMERIRNSLSW